MKIAFLEIKTWVDSVAVFAQHYYGKIKCYDGHDRCEEINIETKLLSFEAANLNKAEGLRAELYRFKYKKGDTTESFLNKSKLISCAKQFFHKELKPKGYVVLLKGSSGTIDPQEMIVGSSELKKKCNLLYEEFESYDGWGCKTEEEKQVRKISDDWNLLLGRVWD